MDLDSRGMYIKLIPSLNGRLYKFNGEVVEPIPMNVDSLLGSYLPYQDIIKEITKNENNGYFATTEGNTNQLAKPPHPHLGSFSFTVHPFPQYRLGYVQIIDDDLTVYSPPRPFPCLVHICSLFVSTADISLPIFRELSSIFDCATFCSICFLINSYG
jgi:hypothetical protein